MDPENLKYVVRRLRKDSGLTQVVVLSLALGIGANTAMFSPVNAVLLRRMPYQHPERLVEVYTSTTEGRQRRVQSLPGDSED